MGQVTGGKQVIYEKVTLDTATPALIWGHINGKPAKMLIDTGAQICLMSETLAKALGCKLTSERTPLHVADGSTVHSKGNTKKFLVIGTYGVDMKVSVMEKLTVPFIVGVHLLRHLKGKVDLTANEVVIGDERTSFTDGKNRTTKTGRKDWRQKNATARHKFSKYQYKVCKREIDRAAGSRTI